MIRLNFYIYGQKCGVGMEDNNRKNFGVQIFYIYALK